jgi:hypothetical protein
VTVERGGGWTGKGVVSPNKTTAKNSGPLFLPLILNRSMNSYFPKTVELRSGVSLQIFAQKSCKDSKGKRNCAFIDATKEKEQMLRFLRHKNAHYGHVQI